MALFVSHFLNKVDKKGRVSVPAPFRAALIDQAFQGILLFRSHAHKCLEGFDFAYMNEVGARLDHFDLFSQEQDDLATAIFGESVQLSFDGDGRIILPADLMDYAGISDRVAFVGLGRKFQLWEPQAFEDRRSAARDAVRNKGMTLPRGDS